MTKRYRYSDPLLILLLISLSLMFLYQVVVDYLNGVISFTDMIVDVAAAIGSAVVIAVFYVEAGNWLESRVKPKLKEKLRFKK